MENNRDNIYIRVILRNGKVKDQNRTYKIIIALLIAVIVIGGVTLTTKAKLQTYKEEITLDAQREAQQEISKQVEEAGIAEIETDENETLILVTAQTDRFRPYPISESSVNSKSI